MEGGGNAYISAGDLLVHVERPYVIRINPLHQTSLDLRQRTTLSLHQVSSARDNHLLHLGPDSYIYIMLLLCLFIHLQADRAQSVIQNTVTGATSTRNGRIHVGTLQTKLSLAQ